MKMKVTLVIAGVKETVEVDALEVTTVSGRASDCRTLVQLAVFAREESVVCLRAADGKVAIMPIASNAVGVQVVV